MQFNGSPDFGAFQHTSKYKGKPEVQMNVTIKSVVKKFENVKRRNYFGEGRGVQR